MALVMNKRPKETWLGCAMRYAEPYGLTYEVKDSYNGFIVDEYSEEEAAYMALEEWDLLDYKPS